MEKSVFLYNTVLSYCTIFGKSSVIEN